MASHGKNGGSYHSQQLARTLGDRVVVQETQTAHNASYYIIGEAHSLSQGATLYETTWYLEPAPVVYPWKLGETIWMESNLLSQLNCQYAYAVALVYKRKYLF